MKRLLAILFVVLITSACAHKQLKAPKKAPCDFNKQEVSEGFEDNTK